MLTWDQILDHLTATVAALDLPDSALVPVDRDGLDGRTASHARRFWIESGTLRPGVGLFTPGLMTVDKAFTVVVGYDADPGLAIERLIGRDEAGIVAGLIHEDARLDGLHHVSFEESDVERNGSEHRLRLTFSTSFEMTF